MSETEKLSKMKEKALSYSLETIKREAEYLKKRAEKVLEKVASNDPYFNSLGELQGNALTLDHAIIKYSNIRATFEDIEARLKEVN